MPQNMNQNSATAEDFINFLVVNGPLTETSKMGFRQSGNDFGLNRVIQALYVTEHQAVDASRSSCRYERLPNWPWQDLRRWHVWARTCMVGGWRRSSSDEPVEH